MGFDWNWNPYHDNNIENEKFQVVAGKLKVIKNERIDMEKTDFLKLNNFRETWILRK